MGEEVHGKRIHCATHGSTPPTFVCCHLAEPNSSGLGVCYEESSQEPWPDLVCNACSEEPPWTHEQALERIRLLCAFCWEDTFGRNSLVRHPDAEGWLHGAVHRAMRRQDRWTERYGILDAARYRYGFDASPPWLGFGPADGRWDVMCEPTVIGSWSARSDTWLWGWANDWWDPSATREIVRAKRAGERLGIERLWRSTFASDEAMAWMLSGAVLDLLPDFEGLYRSPGDQGALFLAVAKTRPVM